ncbi:hypothetical protein CTN03_08240 [Photobacterium angustum]|nr:hypothetical protein CTN03_08240 [Photobacterium angustum]
MASMIAKKQVNFIKPQSTTTDLIKNHLENAKYISIASKDAHLIDAAMISDKIIASNDDTARGVFCELSECYRGIRTIKWFNAITDREFVSNFLSSDCFVPEKYYVVPTKV